MRNRIISLLTLAFLFFFKNAIKCQRVTFNLGGSEWKFYCSALNISGRSARVPGDIHQVSDRRLKINGYLCNLNIRLLLSYYFCAKILFS